MNRSFLALAVACALLVACGPEAQQEGVEESTAEAAALRCVDYIPNGCKMEPWWECTYPNFLISSIETCISCRAGYEPGCNPETCVRPTPRATLCTGQTGQVYDPATCWYQDCDNCYGGKTECNESCVDLATDAKNCGACNNACGRPGGPYSTPRCKAGVCQSCVTTYGGTTCNFY